MKKNLFKKLNLLTVIIISDFLIYSLLYECNKSYPILKNNQCLSTYCKKEEFESGECIIDEPITKTQSPIPNPQSPIPIQEKKI